MKTRVMLVDDNKGMVGMIKEYFNDHKLIDIVLEAYDGEEAMKVIEEHIEDFDVVLLDLIMPKRDGIFVLESMSDKHINKNVIVVTSYNEQETIRKVSEYGVKFFILKPFDLIDLEKKILESVKMPSASNEIINLHKNNVQISVTKILHELGIPSHIKGYQYIREGIGLVYEDQSLIGGITKELYPEIAKRYETNVSRVERAIRHAIEISWNRGDWDLMEEIFGHSVDIDRAKPTNSEFIVTIADKLRLDSYKTNKTKAANY
ncbi:MAG: sporulation transcription factor Spo0A [Bacilli bacterium]